MGWQKFLGPNGFWQNLGLLGCTQLSRWCISGMAWAIRMGPAGY